MIKPIINKARRSSGQELVEFAMTLPILAILVIGILDLGRIVYLYSAMMNAAREGARYGVVHPHASPAVLDRTEERTLGIDPSELNTSVNYSCERVLVSITYEFDPWIPLFGNLPISTSSQLQRERWDTDTLPDAECDLDDIINPEP